MEDSEISKLCESSEKRKLFVDSEGLNNKRHKESFSAIDSLKVAYEKEVARAVFAEKAYEDLYQKFIQSRYSKEFVEDHLLGHGSYGSVVQCTHRLDQCQYAIKRVRFIGSSKILMPSVSSFTY